MPSPHPRPWHTGSLFGDGPRRPLDREQRARFRFLLNAHRRARRLPPLAEVVGNALLKRLSVDGRCDPGHDTLADDAGCSARTVRRALDALRGLNLVAWQRRIVRTGWRVAQTSNAYSLAPVELANPPPIAAQRCGGQSGRETRFCYKRKEAEQQALLTMASQGPNLLAMRRAAIETAMMAKEGRG